MDMVSQLPDDLIFRILWLVPTKDGLAISCASRRWRSLWNQVSRLEFDDRNYENDDYNLFTQFVYKTLALNNAPVLENLDLSLGPKCRAIDVGIWIDTAVAHRLRHLRVNIRSGLGLVSLPSSLFTCETLENLALTRCLVPDVPCCLPSLKNVAYASLPKLLSGCPELESLKVMVEEDEDQREGDVTIA